MSGHGNPVHLNDRVSGISTLLPTTALADCGHGVLPATKPYEGFVNNFGLQQVLAAERRERFLRYKVNFERSLRDLVRDLES